MVLFFWIWFIYPDWKFNMQEPSKIHAHMFLIYMECITYYFKPENLINATSTKGSQGNSRNILLTLRKLRLLNLKLKINFLYNHLLLTDNRNSKVPKTIWQGTCSGKHCRYQYGKQDQFKRNFWTGTGLNRPGFWCFRKGTWLCQCIGDPSIIGCLPFWKRTTWGCTNKSAGTCLILCDMVFNWLEVISH